MWAWRAHHRQSRVYKQKMQEKFVQMQSRVLISSLSSLYATRFFFVYSFFSWERSTAGNTKPRRWERPGHVSQETTGVICGMVSFLYCVGIWPLGISSSWFGDLWEKEAHSQKLLQCRFVGHFFVAEFLVECLGAEIHWMKEIFEFRMATLCFLWAEVPFLAFFTTFSSMVSRRVFCRSCYWGGEVRIYPRKNKYRILAGSIA